MWALLYFGRTLAGIRHWTTKHGFIPAPSPGNLYCLSEHRPGHWYPLLTNPQNNWLQMWQCWTDEKLYSEDGSSERWRSVRPLDRVDDDVDDEDVGCCWSVLLPCCDYNVQYTTRPTISRRASVRSAPSLRVNNLATKLLLNAPGVILHNLWPAFFRAPAFICTKQKARRNSFNLEIHMMIQMFFSCKRTRIINYVIVIDRHRPHCSVET